MGRKEPRIPRSTRRVPSYRLHKPSGQARVIINDEHIYLGRYGSDESREKYAGSSRNWRPIPTTNLRAVAGLRYGRTEVRETEPVKAVDEKWANAVLPYV